MPPVFSPAFSGDTAGAPGTRGSEALALLSSGRFDPGVVISETFALDDLAAALVRNRDDKAGAKKLVMVNPAAAW